MREIRAIIWKEWSETRLFLWIALGLFIGLPIIGGFEEQATSSAHRFEFSASPWVILFGGVLAIVVGVAGTCRDLQTKLEDFWQSRPMGSFRLFIVKFFMGLTVVLLACGVPLIVELLSNYDPSDAKIGLSLAFLWIAVFAIAFASGCFFHKTAHAAAVAVVGMLLIYSLPIVFPPFQRFSSGQLLGLFGSHYLKAADLWNGPLPVFAIGMLAVSVAMGALGLIAVQFGWHVQSEKPLIFGAASAAFLILLESASYQLGRNLPVLSSVDLPAGHRIANLERGDGISVNAAGGSALTMLWVGSPYQQGNSQNGDWQYFLQPFKISANRVELGTESPWHFDAPSYWYERAGYAARSEIDPRVIYQVGGDDADDGRTEIASLAVMSEKNGAPTTQAGPIELWRDHVRAWVPAFVHIWHDRLYIIGERSIVFDITDPRQPKRISDEPIKWTRDNNLYVEEEPTVQLPPAPGMPADERLKFALTCYDFDFENRGAFDGSIWCRSLNLNGETSIRSPGGLLADRLTSLTDETAQFKLIGKYTPTMVQYAIDGGQEYTSLKMKNGLLYTCQNRVVNVFDLSGPRPMQLIGHFVPPSWIQQIELLDDGRAIVGGDKLWLLGAPQRR